MKNIFHSKNINNTNNTWASNQYIRMISEGSCDSEDLE